MLGYCLPPEVDYQLPQIKIYELIGEIGGRQKNEIVNGTECDKYVFVTEQEGNQEHVEIKE